MKIKMMVLTVFSVLLLALPVYSSDESRKSEDLALAQKAATVKRDNFFGEMETKMQFKKTDITAIRAAGYSPYFCMVLLFIAKEANVPVTELIKLRVEGKCWGDMCKAYNLDYGVVAGKFEAAIAANNIKFPLTTGKEQEADIKYALEGGR